MKRLFLGIILSFQVASGLDVLPQSGKVILDFKKCSDRKVQLENFGTCSKKISKGIFNPGCELEISDCVDRSVVELHGVKGLVNGLNDFNSALYLAGIVPVLRNSPAEEFLFFIRSSLCKKLNPGEVPQPKDIGAVSDLDGDIVGAFSYLKEGLIFTKMDPRTLQEYAVTDLEKYEKKISSDEAKTINYYRCEPFEKNHTAPWLDELNLVETEIAHSLPVKVSMSSEKSAILLERLRQLLIAYKQSSGFSQEVLRARLIGVREHLRENTKSVSESERDSKTPLIEFLTVELDKAPTAKSPSSSSSKPAKNRKSLKSKK